MEDEGVMGCHATTTFIQAALKEIPWPSPPPSFAPFPGGYPRHRVGTLHQMDARQLRSAAAREKRKE